VGVPDCDGGRFGGRAQPGRRRGKLPSLDLSPRRGTGCCRARGLTRRRPSNHTQRGTPSNRRLHCSRGTGDPPPPSVGSTPRVPQLRIDEVVRLSRSRVRPRRRLGSTTPRPSGTCSQQARRPKSRRSRSCRRGEGCLYGSSLMLEAAFVVDPQLPCHPCCRPSGRHEQGEDCNRGGCHEELPHPDHSLSLCRWPPSGHWKLGPT
jgi:hypothetical protein